jgi:hypothetical protein
MAPGAPLEDRVKPPAAARAKAPAGTAARREVKSIASGPNEEEIRMRAYQMYLERGASHGRDFDDWLRAEEELRRRLRG